MSAGDQEGPVGGARQGRAGAPGAASYGTSAGGLIADLRREAWFVVRDRSVLPWLALALALAGLAVWSGLDAVAQQRTNLSELLAADAADRAAVQAAQEDWGGAAYYTFHATAQPPSSLAFAAMGYRDLVPWQHRIRMLALEGQIYEADQTNPVIALIGRFDYAFLTAFVLPLLLIVMLHDQQARERAAGRYELLEATAGPSRTRLWALRSGLRGGALLLCLLIPLLFGAWRSGTAPGTVGGAAAVVAAQTAFWGVLVSLAGRWRRPAPVLLSLLLGVWVVLALVVPAGGRVLAERIVSVPAGAEILMTQREAVNDAWDLPKTQTMEAFVARHPEWATYAEVTRPFEWKWYYAFQQVGDQQAEALSRAYREGRLQRDRVASVLAWLSPSALVERTLQRLAGTDLRAALAYEDSVRRFHEELRRFYYPRLFRDEPFDAAELSDLPVYRVSEGGRRPAREGVPPAVIDGSG